MKSDIQKITETDALKLLQSYQISLAPDRKVEVPWTMSQIECGPILDAACGGGFLQQCLLDLGFEVFASDIHPDASIYYDKGPKRPNFMLWDARTCPPKSFINKFGTVLIVSTIEHLDKGDDLKVLRQLCKCISLGGELIITCPYGNDDMRVLGVKAERYYSLERLVSIGAILNLQHISHKIFTKEDQGWPWVNTPDAYTPWKDIICLKLKKIS